MGDLRKSILDMELQKELQKARILEKQGKGKEASVHYIKAGEIYRRIAYTSPQWKAEDMFNVANKYETLGKTIRQEAPRAIGEVPDEVVDSLVVSEKPETEWKDIGNLEEAVKIIKEAIILPFINSKPDYVKSPRTILLYGPPGTGKTLLAKASSNTLNATFFEARMPSLLSKFFGESTKLINALFEKARKTQPSLIFIDELDSLAASRGSDMNEATRRVLGQFLTELDGFNTKKDEKVLIMAATNKPWDLDDALVSRFQKRIYVPLPDQKARKDILAIHLEGTSLSGIDSKNLSERTEGFSGRDLSSLCQEAIINMVREMNPQLENMSMGEIEKYSLRSRPLAEKDFEEALKKIKPATHNKEQYDKWRDEFGG